MAAGNSFFDTTATSPGASPDAVRVGGVEDDGRPALPGTAKDPTFYSGRAYDVGGNFYNRIASASDPAGYTVGDGTSGSAPRVAGLAARVLRRAREAVGDTGYGSRGGTLIVPRRKPPRGPLADARLTSTELLDVLLHSAQPSLAQEGARFVVEGYGWLNEKSADAAVQVLLGVKADRPRPTDDAAYTAATTARAVAYATNGCGF
jgi:hypothetical protein